MTLRAAMHQIQKCLEAERTADQGVNMHDRATVIALITARRQTTHALGILVDVLISEEARQ